MDNTSLPRINTESSEGANNSVGRYSKRQGKDNVSQIRNKIGSNSELGQYALHKYKPKITPRNEVTERPLDVSN